MICLHRLCPIIRWGCKFVDKGNQRNQRILCAFQAYIFVDFSEFCSEKQYQWLFTLYVITWIVSKLIQMELTNNYPCYFSILFNTLTAWITLLGTKFSAPRKYGLNINCIKFVYILWDTFIFHVHAGNGVKIL